MPQAIKSYWKYQQNHCSNSQIFTVCFLVSWLVAFLMSKQHASVSQRCICSHNFTCCHTVTEAADQTFHLTQSQHTDTVLTSPSTDPITPGAWQGCPWSANFKVTGMTRSGKILAQVGFEPRIFHSPGRHPNHKDKEGVRYLQRGWINRVLE